MMNVNQVGNILLTLKKNNISTLIFGTDIEIEIPTEQEVQLKKWDKYIIHSY
ncbi:hypothetical protein ABEP18_25865 [Priestia megaterium]